MREKLVTIAEFDDLTLAQFVRGLLEDRGVHALLPDDNVIAALLPRLSLFGGRRFRLRLQVFASDEARARGVLREAEALAALPAGAERDGEPEQEEAGPVDAEPEADAEPAPPAAVSQISLYIALALLLLAVLAALLFYVVQSAWPWQTGPGPT